MAGKGPGKSHRKGITLFEIVERFAGDEDAHEWFVQRRWPNGLACLECGSVNVSRRVRNRQTPVFHCNDCKYDFTVKTGTIMHASKVSLPKWALAFYLLSTNLKGVSSMKLHRDLGVTQKTAWYMAHRIRETYDDESAVFVGPVEADEKYMGGVDKNRHASKRIGGRGRSASAKTPVAGIKDRATGQVAAQVVPNASGPVLKQFVESHTTEHAVVYTDEWPGYNTVNRPRETVRHSVGEYVRGQASTNGMESFWSLLQRGFTGTYHQMSRKHLHRYVSEFSGRHNLRPLDTEDQMAAMFRASEGRILPYEELIA